MTGLYLLGLLIAFVAGVKYSDKFPAYDGRTPAFQIDFSHEAVNAFWKVWQEVGEPHKHGVYESTWMAFKAAMESQGQDQRAADTTMSRARRAAHKVLHSGGNSKKERTARNESLTKRNQNERN